MKAIWKYAIQPDDFTIDLPRGAQIVSVGVQDQGPVFWALVDPEAETVPRRLRTVGTGHTHPDAFWEGYTFVGTVGPVHGSLWFHLFDGGDLPPWTRSEGEPAQGARGGRGGVPSPEAERAKAALLARVLKRGPT